MPPSIPPTDPSSKRHVRWKRHLRGTARARQTLAQTVGRGSLLLALGVLPLHPFLPRQGTLPAVALPPVPPAVVRTSNFPATIELSALTGSDGFRLNGAAANDRAGRAVSEASDVNGDGFDDLLVGAYGADPNGDPSAGAAYVVFGGPGGFSATLDVGTLDGSNGFTLEGAAADDHAGHAVSGAGDVNGDGFADLLVGAYGADPNGSSSGAAYVVFGGETVGSGGSVELGTLTGSDGFRLNGAAAFDNAGYSASGAGDVNGDGFADLLIGAYGVDPNGAYSGAAYVVFGGASVGSGGSVALGTLNSSTGFRLNGAAAFDYAGRSVSGAGDVNGDGFADLLVGAYGADPNGSYSGAAYVVFGGETVGSGGSVELGTLTGSDGFRLNGAAANDRAGTAVSGAGDVNGDGFADLLVGARYADPNGSNSGAAYVVFGGATVGSGGTVALGTLDGSDGFRLNGAAAFDYAGWSVSGAGDVNGDGFADLIVGAIQPAPNLGRSGAAFVLFGGETVGSSGAVGLGTLDGSDGFRLNGAAAFDYAGFAVSGAGDVNGDGVDDLLIGAPKADPNGGLSGAAYLLFGRGNTVTVGLGALDGSEGFQVAGAAAVDYAGLSVSEAGDVNGDGFTDLILGAPYADPNGNNSGAAYVLFGEAGGFPGSVNLGALDGSTGFRLNGAAGGDLAGWSVSEAGDVNGDGFADLLVGARGADPNGAESGAAYVVFGGAGVGSSGSVALGTLNGSTGFRLNGAAAFDYAGFAVSGAGDVNGDGFADLLVGAFKADPTADNSGAAYVVFGGATVGSSGSVVLGTLNGSTGFRLNGAAAFDYAGRSVSEAGDVNGDGFDDLLVGALEADPNGNESGAAYVLFGGETVGSSGSVALGSLNGSAGFRLNGAAAFDYAGFSVSGADDVNGDGFADLLVGAPRADPNGTNSGAAYVVFGGATVGSGGTVELGTLTGSAGFRLNGAAAGDYAGWSVSGAGDVNGDGFADLIVGVPNADANGTDSGAGYVVFGGATVGSGGSVELGTLDSSDGFVLNGAAYDQAGRAVSGAGDVNGDGFADLLVGAPFADVTDSNAGAAYVLFGSRLNHPILPGGAGDDTLRSTSEPQALIGAQGADGLHGGFGDDLLAGGAGDDQLAGGPGDDLLRGGSGNDTYMFADDWGNDRVEEEQVRGTTDTGDTLDFDDVTAPLAVTLGSISVTDNNGNSVEYGGTEVESVVGGSGQDTFTVTASSLQKNGDLTLNGGGAEEDTLTFDPQGQPFTQSGNPTSGTITLTNSGVTLTYQNMGAVLAVDLASFEAVATPNAIALTWETVSEVNALGFYLRRSTDGAQVGERLHPDLIPAQAPGSGQGASYEWLDESAEPGITYFYWLEAVELSGESALHGPVSALVELPTALTVSPLIMEATPAAPWGALGAALLGLLGALGLRRRR